LTGNTKYLSFGFYLAVLALEFDDDAKNVDATLKAKAIKFDLEAKASSRGLHHSYL